MCKPLPSLLCVLLLLLCFRFALRLLIAPPLLPPDVRLVQVAGAVVACTNTDAAVCFGARGTPLSEMMAAVHTQHWRRLPALLPLIA
jgi:hypothetical protein